MIIIDLIIILVVAIFVALTWRFSRFLRRKAGNEGRWWRILREVILMVTWFLTTFWIAAGVAIAYSSHLSANTSYPYSGTPSVAALPFALPLFFVVGILPVWVGVIALREIIYWYKSGKLDGFPAFVLGATVTIFCFGPILMGGIAGIIELLGGYETLAAHRELGQIGRFIQFVVLVICGALVVAGTFKLTSFISVKGPWGVWLTFVVLTISLFLLAPISYGALEALELSEIATGVSIGLAVFGIVFALIDVFMMLILILKWAIGGPESKRMDVAPEGD